VDIKLEHINNVDKRHGKRVRYDLKLFYPRVNNRSIYTKYNLESPIMETIDISETGISFISRAELNKDDFISFLITIGDNASFWCMAEVKWSEKIEGLFKVGCQFYCLEEKQINLIRNYVSKVLE
jgi:hypothetical protein